MRVVLAAIVMVGLAVRLWGLTFGLPLVYARPDELLLIGKVVEFFRGDPNPHFFEYPTLYLYTIAGVYAIYYGWGLIGGRFTDAPHFLATFKTHHEPFFLIPRAMSALLGAATVWLVHAVATPLFGRAVGVVSAFFMAIAFLHVRDSHYATTDVPMVFFVMCAMLAIVRLHLDRRSSDAYLAGVLAGVAMGVKYNAMFLAVPMVVVEVLHAAGLRGDLRRVVRETHLWRMAVPFLFVFLAGSPYLVLDYSTASRDLEALRASTASGMTPPELLGRGWTYHLPYSLWYGLGWPMLFASLAGLVLMAVRRSAAAAVLGSFPVTYYLAAGAGYNVFVRYMIPVVPFLCLFAGYFVWEVAALLASRIRLRVAAVATVFAGLVAAPSAASVVQFDRLLATEDSRLVASRWMNEQAPAGATIYMSGNRYGHLELEDPYPPSKYRYYKFERGAFTEEGRLATTPPEWIVVQKSEIPYSHISRPVEDLLEAEYTLVHTVRAAADNTSNFYDIQDGFYLPFGGFRRVTRPGPNILIYRWKGKG